MVYVLLFMSRIILVGDRLLSPHRCWLLVHCKIWLWSCCWAQMNRSNVFFPVKRHHWLLAPIDLNRFLVNSSCTPFVTSEPLILVVKPCCCWEKMLVRPSYPRHGCGPKPWLFTPLNDQTSPTVELLPSATTSSTYFLIGYEWPVPLVADHHSLFSKLREMLINVDHHY